MEYQNNNGNYDNRNRRKSKKKKRVYYKAVCIVLCLLIAVAALGIVNLVRSGKESPIQMCIRDSYQTDERFVEFINRFATWNVAEFFGEAIKVYCCNR